MIIFWLGLIISGQTLYAEKCEPPTFYISLPRDMEWYYGVARDPDTERARDQAVRNLGKQITGTINEWNAAELEEVVGPGMIDRRQEIAENAAALLEQSSFLSGWEQDDFARCEGWSYVLVRIERDHVKKFVANDRQFKEQLIGGLSKKISMVESKAEATTKTVDMMMQRLKALETQNQAILSKLRDRRAAASGSPRAIEADLKQQDNIQSALGKLRDEVSTRKKVSVETRVEISKREQEIKSLSKQIDSYQAMLSDSEREMLDRVQRNIKLGWFSGADTSAIMRIFKSPNQNDKLREFLKKVAFADRGWLGYFNPQFEPTREWALGYLCGLEESFQVNRPLSEQEWNATEKYCNEYRKRYPKGASAGYALLYLQLVAKKKRELLLKN